MNDYPISRAFGIDITNYIGIFRSFRSGHLHFQNYENPFIYYLIPPHSTLLCC